jgi:hypothetical protein
MMAMPAVTVTAQLTTGEHHCACVVLLLCDWIDSATSREQDELLCAPAYFPLKSRLNPFLFSYKDRWAPGGGPCCFCGEFNDDANLGRMVTSLLAVVSTCDAFDA